MGLLDKKGCPVWKAEFGVFKKADKSGGEE